MYQVRSTQCLFIWNKCMY